jgi:hypothetical protein
MVKPGAIVAAVLAKRICEAMSRSSGLPLGMMKEATPTSTTHDELKLKMM